MARNPQWRRAPAGLVLLMALAPLASAGSPSDPEMPDPAGDSYIPYTDITGLWANENDDSLILGITLVDSDAMGEGPADGEIFDFYFDALFNSSADVDMMRGVACRGPTEAGMACAVGTYLGSSHTPEHDIPSAIHDEANETWEIHIPREYLPPAPIEIRLFYGRVTLPDPLTPSIIEGSEGAGDFVERLDNPATYQFSAPTKNTDENETSDPPPPPEQPMPPTPPPPPPQPPQFEPEEPDNETTEPANEESPGMAPLATALALLVAVALASRRQRKEK